jgi:hypothetical protein
MSDSPGRLLAVNEETFITRSLMANPERHSMPKFKTTAEALKIVHNKDQIRNLGIIAHVDHGTRAA